MSKAKTDSKTEKATDDLVVVDHGSKGPKIYVSGQIPFKEADHCHIIVNEKIMTLRAAIDSGLVLAWQGALSGCWHWGQAPMSEAHKNKSGTTEEKTARFNGEDHPVTVIHN